ncbi:MAG: type I phosphoribosyltransferase, partial [Minisyncoccota bacterium]
GTKKESVKLIEEQGGEVAGLVISFDRQERGTDSELSAMQEFQREYHAPVIAIAMLKDLITVLKKKGDRDEVLKEIYAYQKKYGV